MRARRRRCWTVFDVAAAYLPRRSRTLGPARRVLTVQNTVPCAAGFEQPLRTSVNGFSLVPQSASRWRFCPCQCR